MLKVFKLWRERKYERVEDFSEASTELSSSCSQLTHCADHTSRFTVATTSRKKSKNDQRQLHNYFDCLSEFNAPLLKQGRNL